MSDPPTRLAPTLRTASSADSCKLATTTIGLGSPVVVP
jgi:hypothetical protein